MRRLVLAAAVLFVVFTGVGLLGGSPSVGSVQAGWVITDLGTLGGRSSSASAISDRGEIVGASDTVH